MLPSGARFGETGRMIGLLLLPFSALALYWLIRLAVRHGIEDAWERRADHELAETASERPVAEPRGVLWAWYRLLGALGWFG
jgi:hypothetical protein